MAAADLRPGGPIPPPRRTVLPPGGEVRPVVSEPRSHVGPPRPRPPRPFDWQRDDPTLC